MFVVLVCPLPSTCYHYLSPVTHHLLPATRYQLPATCYPLPATSYMFLLPATHYVLPAPPNTTYMYLQPDTRYHYLLISMEKSCCLCVGQYYKIPNITWHLPTRAEIPNTRILPVEVPKYLLGSKKYPNDMLGSTVLSCLMAHCLSLSLFLFFCQTEPISEHRTLCDILPCPFDLKEQEPLVKSALKYEYDPSELLQSLIILESLSTW